MKYILESIHDVVNSNAASKAAFGGQGGYKVIASAKKTFAANPSLKNPTPAVKKAGQDFLKKTKEIHDNTLKSQHLNPRATNKGVIDYAKSKGISPQNFGH